MKRNCAPERILVATMIFAIVLTGIVLAGTVLTGCDDTTGGDNSWASLPGTELTLEKVDNFWGGYRVKIDVTELGLTGTIAQGDWYELDIAGYFNQAINQGNSTDWLTSVALMQDGLDDDNPHVLTGYKLATKAVNIPVGTLWTNKVVFSIDAEPKADEAVYLQIAVNPDPAITAPVQFKYTSLALKKTTQSIVLTKNTVWEGWDDSFLVSKWAMNSVAVGDYYKVTIKGTANYDLPYLFVELQDNNGALTRHTAFSPITANKTFTEPVVMKVTKASSNNIKLFFGFGDSDYKGSNMNPVIIVLDEPLTLEKTTSTVFMKANHWEDNHDWSSFHAVKLNDYIDVNSLAANTTYNVTISGNSNIKMTNFCMAFRTDPASYGEITEWDTTQQGKSVNAGDFSVPFTLKTVSSLGSLDPNDAFIQLWNGVTVPNTTATGTIMATITNFNVAIAK